MPCICADFVARLAIDLKLRGARLVYGHSDFSPHPEHADTDVRNLDGLRAFYQRAAAENRRIDLCIHCLAKQPLIDTGQKAGNRLDIRTVFVGTLLAAQQIQTREGVGTILNLALLDSADPNDPILVRAAIDLLCAVTQYAAEIAPQKIRALALVRQIGGSLSDSSTLTSSDLALARFDPEGERRRLLRVIRQLLCNEKPVSSQVQPG